MEECNRFSGISHISRLDKLVLMLQVYIHLLSVTSVYSACTLSAIKQPSLFECVSKWMLLPYSCICNYADLSNLSLAFIVIFQACANYSP